MNGDPILRRVWRVQAKLAREANYDPVKYAVNAEKKALEIEKRYGFKFRYADPATLVPRHARVAEAREEYGAKSRKQGPTSRRDTKSKPS
jgi:hypothetical protein